MKSELGELIACLAAISESTLVVGAAALPRGARTGHTRPRGDAIDTLIRELLRRRAAMRAYRVGWSEVFLVEEGMRLSIDGELAEASVAATNDLVDIRLGWVTVSSAQSSAWFDMFFGDISAVQHFGDCEWLDGRMVNGKIA